MSSATLPLGELQPAAGTLSAARPTYRFALAFISLILAACCLAGFAPLGFSIATVFLFAGPHNWLEARYMLTRMPARWGALTPYFSLGIAGVIGLTVTMAALRWLGDWFRLSADSWLALYAIWNTALIAWIVSLALLRSRQNPRRNWLWLVPAGLMLISLNWLFPLTLGIGLVYLHPLIALWFLDRELSRPSVANPLRVPSQTAYRFALLLVPICLFVLWWNLGHAPDLPGNDWLSRQITQHAGSGVISGVSTHFLVSAHTFLEMLHYGVWIVAIPLVSLQSAPWQLGNIPLARRSRPWRWAVAGAIALGAAVMIVLWGGFLADYPLTRDIYFTVAMLHVLAEAPFLLRLL